MGNEKKILSDVERIGRNRRSAEAYYAAYNKQAVKDGAVYDEWIYAPHADYWSPYFGNGTIDLETNPISVEDSATMEALSYSIEFREWAPVDFECFPAVNGVAWKTHFGGYRKSDVMMPKMDGYEMVAALRQMHTNIPILLITAKDSFLDLRKGFLTGADDYMTKPININEMVLRVQALLRRSQMNAEQSCVLVQPLWTTTPSASHPGQRSSSYRRRNSCCCSSCCPIQARRSLGSS